MSTVLNEYMMMMMMVADIDDNLFANIRHNPRHLLHKLLPDN